MLEQCRLLTRHAKRSQTATFLFAVEIGQGALRCAERRRAIRDTSRQQAEQRAKWGGRGRKSHRMGSAGDQVKSCTMSSFTLLLSSSPMSGASYTLMAFFPSLAKNLAPHQPSPVSDPPRHCAKLATKANKIPTAQLQASILDKPLLDKK